MKKIISVTLVLMAGVITAGVFSSFKKADSNPDSLKVYVQNKCSSDVKIYVTQSGGGSTYTIEDGSTKPMALDPGQKIYDESRSTLIYEVTSSSEGKTVVVCD